MSGHRIVRQDRGGYCVQCRDFNLTFLSDRDIVTMESDLGQCDGALTEVSPWPPVAPEQKPRPEILRCPHGEVAGHWMVSGDKRWWCSAL